MAWPRSCISTMRCSKGWGQGLFPLSSYRNLKFSGASVPPYHTVPLKTRVASKIHQLEKSMSSLQLGSIAFHLGETFTWWSQSNTGFHHVPASPRPVEASLAPRSPVPCEAPNLLNLLEPLLFLLHYVRDLLRSTQPRNRT